MSWANLQPPSFQTFRLPDVSACKQKASELFAEAVKPDSEALDIAELIDEIMAGKTAFGLKAYRALPWSIFHLHAMSKNPELARRVLNLGDSSRGFWRRLFRVWIYSYSPDTEVGKIINAALEKNVQKLSPDQKHLAENIDLFKGMLNGNFLSDQLLQKNDFRLANEIGLRNGNADTQLAGKVVELLAKRVSSAKNEQMLEQFLNLTLVKGDIFDSIAASAMVAVIQGAKDFPPESSLVKKCIDVVSDNYPDPVIEEPRWPSVPSTLGGNTVRLDCIAVVRRWNAFQSINVFFKIIEETTTGSEHSHQFPKRKKFWLSYFNQSAVSDAWVLLGRKAQAYMRQLESTGNEEITKLRCGQIVGAQNEQSALIMRVGNLTVVEWSHSGACRVWKSTDGRAPPLFRPLVNREELMNEALRRITHDHRGNWINKLQQVIKSDGGVRRRL